MKEIDNYPDGPYEPPEEDVNFQCNNCGTLYYFETGSEQTYCDECGSLELEEIE